ncbi:glutathione S-transferase family protein [Photobacterium galatheae]|uniref:Glutathione S-transferase n=1 Tax=Photobacterium galatheae TaxID=1654360 RepID=A0A066RQ39_9GAMM|nr:glutathione S-transferase family protein [Photobacterium galatheae]KDM89792.1 glutathione S-transferase [Photobacterium galatheae]MCM0151443.1 glutathione S-transferase family protein [Photobacterium galatheae]
MYQLFYYPRNASWAPHMLLEEIDTVFELILVDRKSEQQKSPEYLKLNPTGRIPTLADNDQIITESAAICLHLCEKHPESNLLPEIGDPDRARFFQWLFYLTTTLQPELMLYFYPDRHTTLPDTANAIASAQEARITDMFAFVDQSLAGKNFLVGDHISVCDFFLFMLSHWASELTRPPLAFEHLGRYLRTLAQRPAIRRACETEGTPLTAYQ